MADSSIEFPIFPLFSDFMAWLIPIIEKFPRSQRFILGSRLLDTSYYCQRDLIRARKVRGAARADALLSADVELEILRLQLRTAHELHCLTVRQYEHGAGILNQIGGFLGSWRN